MGKIKFLLINPSSPVWRVEGRRRPRGSRYFRFSMLPSLYVAASMPGAVETKILDEDVEPIDFGADAVCVSDTEYAKELFSEMIPLQKQWYSQCGVRIAEDESLLDLASRSGCRSLFVGFESLSEQNLSFWKKDCNRGKDYLSAVRKLHDAKIGVCAAFVFGSDGDTPDVFGKTLEFLLESNVESVQATRITPFPGTPLFEEMERQGRIFDKDWSHYDFNHVVFEPLHMSAETLHLGVAWVLRQFFARRRIARRVWKSLGYLRPVTVLRAVVPVNFGYRHRLTVDGTFQRGDDFAKFQK
jgi:hypothetical protein